MSVHFGSSRDFVQKKSRRGKANGVPFGVFESGSSRHADLIKPDRNGGRMP